MPICLLQKIQHLYHESDDSLVPFGFEGKGSPAGSIGGCSNLGEGEDLGFLNNLGPKFTTLAEICGGTKFTEVAPKLPPPPKPIMDHSKSISMHTNTVNTANVETNSHIEENVLIRNTQVVSDVQPVQTLMVQQQPVYYMVEPQVSNTMLLAERPTMGLTQGMYVLNNAPVTERVLVQGAMPAQATIAGGDRMMLLETHGGSTTAQTTGLLQSAHLSGSQLLLVDTGVQGGQVLQGTLQRGGISGSQGLMLVEGQGTLQRGGISGSQGLMLVEGQGTLQRGGISGSQGIMVMEGQGVPTVHGSFQKSVPVAGASQSTVHVVERQVGTSGITQGSLQGGVKSTAMSQNGTIGLNTSTTHGLPSSRKVVVQEKKVVKTNL